MIDLRNYELVIFDWDGVLVDSQGIYRELDRLFVKDFYGMDVPVEEFYRLSSIIKTGAVNGSENDYYRYLDSLYGDGNTSLDVIWENIYKVAPRAQAMVCYKPGAVEMLRKLRTTTAVPIALSTSSSLKDLEFFSSDQSITASELKPLEYFDYKVTFDDVRRPKPDPESYDRVIKHYGVAPEKVLVFEDSLSGVQSAKKAGAEVVVLYDRHANRDRSKIEGLADFFLDGWEEFIETLSRQKFLEP